VNFPALQRSAQAAGIEAVKCTAWHWQLRGPNIVNYYPGKGTVYVNGMVQALALDGDAAGARALVALATRPLPLVPEGERTARPTNTRAQAQRRRLWRRDPRCHWCGARLETASAGTLDHRIPLAAGGSQRADNVVLACRQRNLARGHTMPELRS
jgi:hypothetical protein